MKVLKIRKKTDNLELVSKLMNSVCAKYDCSVRYNAENGTIDYTGDDDYKSLIAEETINIFAKKR
ncbi:hypothetical protein DENIS_1941 [Desulfonema ishimotonii]|uniref:Uncharacterized protein n=1 Tax=Desulfonema ishimotonii TaxID=45657 RepID=A0A401FVJ4_9BACT|nr:hypothetical protein [Desulfonema ishimotonii]GBC60981.1 hypothetical protein DENIS_1941 [Desulfonema ishimotonii]